MLWILTVFNSSTFGYSTDSIQGELAGTAYIGYGEGIINCMRNLKILYGTDVIGGH